MAHRHSSSRGSQSLREPRGIDFRRPPALHSNAASAFRQLLTAVHARVRRSRLDAALAHGADPCSSSALAYRAAQLTNERTREKIAAWVADILASAKRPARPFSAAIEVDRDEVLAAEPLLAEVRELLRSSAPVYARGVAMIADMLHDGGSPLYLRVRPGELCHELELVMAALEGRHLGG